MDSQQTRSLSVPIWGLFIIAVIAVLYIAQSVFIPIFMATLIAFLLTPPVSLLAKYHIPRSISSAIVIVLSSLLIGTLSSYMAVKQHNPMSSSKALIFSIF